MRNGPKELKIPLRMEKYDENTFISYDVNGKYMVFLKSDGIMNKNYKFHDVLSGLVFFKIYPISGLKYLCIGISQEGTSTFIRLTNIIELEKCNFYFSPEYKVLKEYKAADVTSETLRGFIDVCTTDTIHIIQVRQ